MFVPSKVMGTPFRDATDDGTTKVQEKEMYVCTLGVLDNLVRDSFEQVANESLFHPFARLDHPLVSKLYEDDRLLSEEHKYYVNIRYEFFHLILDTLMSVLYIYENDPKAVFAISASKYVVYGEGNYEKSLEFLTEVLDKNNIKFHLIDGSKFVTFDVPAPNLEVPVYKIKNCTVVNQQLSRLMSFRDLIYLSDKYLLPLVSSNESAVDEGLKVYISRGGASNKGESFRESDDPMSGYSNPKDRIYEENLIEEYVKSIGFTVLKPSKDLSILDQVRFMSKAKVLAGVTGTGFVNSLFMDKGGTVIELIVELNYGETSSITVVDYWHISQAKNHTYVGVDLIDKQGATAVEKLKSLFEALDLNKLS